MVCRVDALLRCLLKLLLDVSSDSGLSDAVRHKLMNEAALCIKLLDRCCHGNLQVSLPADGLTWTAVGCCTTFLITVPSVHLTTDVCSETGFL